MPGAQNYTAVGVFIHREQARSAISALQQAGFRPEAIGVAIREEGVAEKGPVDSELETRVEEAAGAGAVTGGALGALASAAVTGMIPGIGPFIASGLFAALLGGITVGAAVGGLIGVLVGVGLTEEEADYYEREFTAGRIIVAVQAGDRSAEAADILRRSGAYRASVAKAAGQARPPAGGQGPPAAS